MKPPFVFSFHRIFFLFSALWRYNWQNCHRILMLIVCCCWLTFQVGVLVYLSCNPLTRNSVSQDRLGYVIVINKMNILVVFKTKLCFFSPHISIASGKSMERDIFGVRETWWGLGGIETLAPLGNQSWKKCSYCAIWRNQNTWSQKTNYSWYSSDT